MTTVNTDHIDYVLAQFVTNLVKLFAGKFF
jgi:hypothetical protein